MLNPAILALIRQILTVAGTALVAKGYVQASEIEPVIGAMLTIGSVIWSIADKGRYADLRDQARVGQVKDGPGNCAAGSARHLDRAVKPGPFHRFTVSMSSRVSQRRDYATGHCHLSRFEMGAIVHPVRASISAVASICLQHLPLEISSLYQHRLDNAHNRGNSRMCRSARPAIPCRKRLNCDVPSTEVLSLAVFEAIPAPRRVTRQGAPALRSLSMKAARPGK